MKAMSGKLPENVKARLRKIFGKNVSFDLVDLICYSSDVFPESVQLYARHIPDAVVVPTNVDQIRELLKLANEYKIPIIPWGAGTNLTGAATPLSGGIVVDMKKMNRIIEINEDELYVFVEAGITLERLEKFLQNKGYTIGHEPGSFPSATVGGAIATNSVGYRAIKYGFIGDIVLGLEVVLPRGDLLVIRPATKSSSGYNLKWLFIGSEGTLGIVTKAWLKIRKAPEERILFCALFKSFEEALLCAIDIFRRGLDPVYLEVNDENAMLEFEDYVREGAKAMLIFGFEGLRAEVKVKSDIATKICSRHNAIFVNEEFEREFLKNKYTRYARLPPGKFEVTEDYYVPVRKILKLKRKFEKIVERYGLENLGISVWIFPSLFEISLRFSDSQIATYRKVVEEFVKEVADAGGSLSHCHGVGTKLSAILSLEHGDTGFDIMRSIKQIFDPNNILNPGKWP